MIVILPLNLSSKIKFFPVMSLTNFASTGSSTSIKLKATFSALFVTPSRLSVAEYKIEDESRRNTRKRQTTLHPFKEALLTLSLRSLITSLS